MKLINSYSSGNVVALDTSITERRKQYLQNLAVALTAGLENPFGSEIVAIIGSGHERNNREALLNWVFFMRHDVFAVRMDGGDVLEYLRCRLEERLEQYCC